MDRPDKSWEFDELDDGSLKIVAEVQLRKYRLFLEEYTKSLLDVEDALDESRGNAWDWSMDPIALDITPYEQADMLDIVRTENKVFNKTITVFMALCEEVFTLKREAQTEMYSTILLYGEGKEEGTVADGQAQIMMSRFLPFLQRVSVFADHVNLVVKNIIHQLASLYSPRSTAQVIDVTDVHLETVFQSLGDALIILVTLDELTLANTLIRDHWTLYKRMMKTVRSNCDTFGVDQEQLPGFEQWILALEGKVLDGMLYQNCIEQGFDDMTVSVTANTVFREEFTLSMRCIHAYLEPRLGEFNEREQRNQFLSLCALFVLQFQLFRVVDKKLIKAVWDIQKKIPAIHLFGDILICPNEFLSRKIPQLAQVVDRRGGDFDTFRREHLVRLDEDITRFSQTCFMQICTWLVRMEDHNPKLKEDISESIGALCQMLVQGVLFSYRLSHYVKTYLTLHLDLNTPLKASQLRAVFRLMELSKAIEQMFHRRSLWIVQVVPHIIQLYSHQAIRVLKACQDKLISDRQYSARRLDTIAALNLLQSSFNGPPTCSRLMSIKLAMHIVTTAKVLSPQHLELLHRVVVRLETVGNLKDIINTNCNMSFFYWHRGFVTNYLQELYESPMEAHRIHYLFACLNDCVQPLQSLRHEEYPQTVIDGFEKDITSIVDENITRRLCRDIENDLRLHIHTGVVKLDDRNPFRVKLRDLSHFLQLLPIRFLSTKIDINSQVTHYLDVTFYDLTTVQPNDWKVYGQMRNLARQKYGLNMQEVHLPSSTLEQGLDVLQIMRNISIFVSSYNYNLNNQIFIERQSNNKFLNTINIRHIANSIRTHGFGIMNTTVNFTYQYLRKKFFQFSQFLYDDHIKSRLIKDLRYFKEVREQTDQQYPFERAEKFTKIIRKLGVNEKGESYLDQFRKLITEIGNAMGYIRMIRSGGFHCCSNAVSFVPDLETIISFEELVHDEDMSTETVEAAKNVDSAIQSLTEKFGIAFQSTANENTEYFKMLVSAFAKEFRSEKNSHLKNFHVMVPPLCLNFVEYMIGAKDKITRKNKIGAAFTDDGFAMGVAFILKLLDQYAAFDSLHWFRSCKTHYASEKKKIQQVRQNGREDEKLQQTISLSLKRISSYEKELDLLFYSLSSARIFFRADQTAAEEAEAEKESGKQDDVGNENHAGTLGSSVAAPEGPAPAI